MCRAEMCRAAGDFWAGGCRAVGWIETGFMLKCCHYEIQTGFVLGHKP